jgi:methylphosphotriester-DNA--protein-cysteine methyltransferase
MGIECLNAGSVCRHLKNGVRNSYRTARRTVSRNTADSSAEAFPKLISRLKYIDAAYTESATFAKLRQELGASRYPLHYLFGAHDAVNPEKKGTKATAHYLLEVPAGGSKVVRNLPVCEYDRLSRLTD